MIKETKIKELIYEKVANLLILNYPNLVSNI